jgi:hypothetical protein
VNLFGWIRNQWDRALAIVASAAGLVFLLVGWLGASRSTLTTEQIPYLVSGAVGGLFALGIGATLWLSADLHDEFRKLEELHDWMQAEAEGDRPVTLVESPAPVSEKDSKPSVVRRRPRSLRDRPSTAAEG